MKKIFLIIVFASLACVLEGRTVGGKVLCEGKGIPGVVVSDGCSSVATDGDGKWSIETDSYSRHVFVSTPAGYYFPSEGGVSGYWHKLTDGCDVYDFTLCRKKRSDVNHSLFVIADPQVYDRGELPLLEAAVADLASEVERAGETVGICCGDIVSYDHSLYRDINRILDKSGLEFRNVMGNHDMKIWGRSHEQSVQEFEKVYGPAYYSFNVGKVHYVMLNDNFYIGRDYFYIGYIDERQLRWLENDLSFVPEGSVVVVSMHIPTTLSPDDRKRFDYGEISITLSNKAGLYSLLEPYDVQILSGHMHTSTNQVISDRMYEHNVASLSGTWWCGPLCGDGTPSGYKIFNVEGDRISWIYKGIGCEKDLQLRAYDNGSDVIANVWDYDEKWTVEYYENGVKMCDMDAFEGKDPDAVAYYESGRKFKHSYAKASRTSHLFRGEVSDRTARKEVRVTDRFGRKYVVEVK